MSNEKIIINNTPIFLRRAYVKPAYGEKAIITTNVWEYVELWLQRNKHSTASWLQARAFYDVVPALPIAARPLLIYYFALNAASTLLDVSKIKRKASHGVAGRKLAGSRASLGAEAITIGVGGGMGGLRRYFSTTAGPTDVSTNLKELFSALSYLHRPYTLTYTSKREQLIPVTRPYFAKTRNGNEGYIECTVSNERWKTRAALSVIPSGFEFHQEGREILIRKKVRFRLPSRKQEKLLAIEKEHAKVRGCFKCITRANQHWYLGAKGLAHNELPEMVMMFAALHRMSELARYDPKRMTRHLNSNHNWLISEFIRDTPGQFLSQVATEITKHSMHVSAGY